MSCTPNSSNINKTFIVGPQILSTDVFSACTSLSSNFITSCSGNTSITLYMEARAHNVYSGKQNTILSTNIKFVRIDEVGEPVPISERIKEKYANKKKEVH